MKYARQIPENSTPVQNEAINAIVYTYERDGKILAIGYHGKKSTSDFHYRFQSIESRQKYIDQYFSNLTAHKELKEERKAKRLAYQHSLKVGDVLVCSWGYEQTNVDFYQVIEVSGKMVSIREIDSSMPNGEEGFMTGYVIPLKNKFTNEKVLRKVVGEGNSVRITSFSSACLWNGKPSRTSWYG